MIGLAVGAGLDEAPAPLHKATISRLNDYYFFHMLDSTIIEGRVLGSEFSDDSIYLPRYRQKTALLKESHWVPSPGDTVKIDIPVLPDKEAVFEGFGPKLVYLTFIGRNANDPPDIDNARPFNIADAHGNRISSREIRKLGAKHRLAWRDEILIDQNGDVQKLYLDEIKKLAYSVPKNNKVRFFLAGLAVDAIVVTYMICCFELTLGSH